MGGGVVSQEKYLKILKKLRLIDDAFFSACFDDNVDDVMFSTFCESFLKKTT